MHVSRLTCCWQTCSGLIIALMLTALLAGCGGDGIYPVEGQVVWEDGKPATELKNSIVSFNLPEKGTGARGTIQADGSFRLTTKNPDDGALAGEYKVLIVETGRKALGGPDSSAIAPGFMDSRYSDPSTTDLKATVTSGVNKIKLTVKRAKR
jgi:hypothetical protein